MIAMPPFSRQIGVTHRCTMRYRERELADTGLAGCHVHYLTALFRQPGMTQEELARELNVNKSSVTRQLTGLEEKGYIRREPEPTDRRIWRVYPTDKADALKPRLFDTLRAWREYLTADFTPEEKALLDDLMGRVAQRAEAYVKGGKTLCEQSSDT